MGGDRRGDRGSDRVERVVPALTPAATDARVFRDRGTTRYGVGLFDHRVSFSDFLDMFHGNDERVSVESLGRTADLLGGVLEGLGEAHRRVNLVADIDGVVLGDQPVPGAGGALERFDGEGWNVLFVTNNSSRGAADIADRIHRIAGYPATQDQVLHSGRAAATLVGRGPAFVPGGDGIVEGWKRAVSR